jgi:hypothetical protein
MTTPTFWLATLPENLRQFAQDWLDATRLNRITS